MFDRRTFFTALGSGVAATALVAVAGSAQAAPALDTLLHTAQPAHTAAPVEAETIEMRGRRRRARRVVRRHRRRARRAVRRARRAS